MKTEILGVDLIYLIGKLYHFGSKELPIINFKEELKVDNLFSAHKSLKPLPS